MSINLQYVPAFSINEIITDKDTGLPLVGGKVYFYRDEINPTMPKNVWQITGSPPNYNFIQLPNPMILNATGGFQDSLGNPVVPYFLPYDSEGEIELYTISVYSAGDIFQFNREAVPYTISQTTPESDIINNDNILSNPQFVETNLVLGKSTVFTISSGGTISLAPDWDLVATGTGTVTLEWIAPIATNTLTNPPYVMDIQSTGIDSLTLRQTLANSPRISASHYISGNFIASSVDSSSHTLTLSYVPSGGSLTSTTILQETITTSSFVSLEGILQIEGTLNPDPANTGYVNIDLTIPVGAHIQVSSFQIVALTQNVNVPFDEQASNRQRDHLFHYYESSILMQPKTSLLTGWNFGQNPFQFYPTTVTTASSQCQYIADQTILWSETASAYDTERAPAGNNFSLALSARAGKPNNLFAIIQYIDTKTLVPYWQTANPLSSVIKSVFTGNLTPVLKMRIIYRSDAPPALSSSEPIVSLAPGGDPVFAAGWTAITPLNDPAYTMTSDTSQYHDYVFNQFTLPIMPSDTAMIGIVLYTNARLDSVTPGLFVMESGSLVPNRFAVEETPRTYDQTLSMCQYYYEKSYADFVLPAAVTTLGQRTENMLINHGTGDSVFLRSFSIPFKQVKRAIPSTVNVYPTQGTTTTNNMTLSIYLDGSLTAVYVGTNPMNIALAGNWSYTAVSTTGLFALCSTSGSGVANLTTTAGNTLYEAILTYQYTVDSRLGV